MSKKIVSVGLYIDDNRVFNIKFDCCGTLLDGDIVIYQPKLSQDWTKNKTCTVINHWKKELLEAYHEGKTILIYIPYPGQTYLVDVWFDIDEKKDLFDHLPVIFGSSYDLKDIKKIEIENDVEFLREYWELVRGVSQGLLVVDGLFEGVKRVLKPYTGNKAVGVLSQSKDKRLGNVLLIPPFESKKGKITVGDEDITTKVCDAIIRMDQNLKNPKSKEEEKIPEWVSEIKLPKEDEFEIKLGEVESSIQKLKQQKAHIEQEKQDYSRIKGLLYGGGHNLEELVRNVLKKLGFENVRSMRESEFEVDIVFEYGEKVFIGEIEGKDKRAIDKDKIDQLVSNVAQFSEYQKDCIPSRGFLFGNGYRLVPLEERGIGFTEGAIKTAKNLNCVLIETKDLYEIAKNLQEGINEECCKKIRNLIIGAESGVLDFNKENK